MNELTRVVVAGVLFVLVVLSGIWVSRSGRPLNVAISTVHKLVSLAAGVLVLVTIYQRNQDVPLNGMEWLVIVVTGVCFAGTVASGGVLSSDEPVPVAVLRVHQVGPVLAVLSTASLLYLVLGR